MYYYVLPIYITRLNQIFTTLFPKLKDMKTIISVIAFLTFTFSFSQRDTNLNLTVQEKIVDDGGTGIYPKGKGSFLYRSVMSKGILGSQVNKSFEIARRDLKDFAEKRDAIYNEIDATYNRNLNTIRLVFELKNQDGSLYLTRDEAIVAIKELMELLDLGILTQEEFDKKAEVYKKTILNH